MYYCLVDEVATLAWLGNLADLELHTSLSRAPAMQRPTVIAFDLDPGAPADIVQCCQVAIWVRDIFSSFGLESFAKTSGSKGLQIYIPLNTAVTYDQTKPFAHAIARLLEERHPDLVVSDMKKSLRSNKVLVDWSQNDSHKTTVNVYSLRAREYPTVSTPVTWEEVETCLQRKNSELLVFKSDQVLQRISRSGDLFEPVLKLKQKLPSLEKLGASDSQPTSLRPAKAGPAGRPRRAAAAPRKRKSSSV
jgi:bifunctional non-homologous end joining protein LigD